MDQTRDMPLSPSRGGETDALSGGASEFRRGSTTHPSAMATGAPGGAPRWLRARWVQGAAASIGALGAFMFWRRRTRA